MVQSIGILDKDFELWVIVLLIRYRIRQIIEAIKLISVFLRYFWELGKDIED